MQENYNIEEKNRQKKEKWQAQLGKIFVALFGMTEENR